MKAMAIDRFGGPEVLHMAEVPTPAPAPGEVLIRIAATSVNPVEWKIREGMLEALFPHHFPLILGWDAAGTVAALGEGVDCFQVGQPVYAYCRKPEIQWGTYAEYVAMSAQAVAPKPGGLSFADAATLPLVGLTSWQALFDVGDLRAGEWVLIHAAAGGTGSMAVQLAKWAGAHVIATAGAANHDYVRGLGADHVIDYGAEDFVRAVEQIVPGGGVDMAYANVGGDVLPRSLAATRQGGRLVSIVNTPDADQAQARNVAASFHFVTPNGRELRQLAALVECGRLRPPPVEALPLEQAAEAQERSRQGHVKGKLVLTP